MKEIVSKIETIIRNYDLPLRTIAPAGNTVIVKENIFRNTVGYIHPQLLVVPEHTDLVAAVVGMQNGQIVIGEYRRGLPGCFVNEVFSANHLTILPVLLKVTVDSYSRYIPDLMLMSSYFDGIECISAGAPANIEFVASWIPHSIIFTHIIPTDVSPAKWKLHNQTLRKRISEVNVPQEWMSLDDALSFADSFISEYGLSFKHSKPQRAFFPCNEFGIFIPVREYPINENSKVLIGVFKSAGGEVPAIIVTVENEIISLRLATKGHIVGLLFGQALKAICGATVHYTSPNTESCYITVWLGKDVLVDTIHILENGKLMSPSEWNHTLKRVIAKVFYFSL